MTLDELRQKHSDSSYDLFIGIDVGVKTGISFYDPHKKNLLDVRTVPIHEAMKAVSREYAANGKKLKVYFEDARQRTWFGSSGREKLQGAGSVKRDSRIWEDFLSDLGVDFEMVAPKRNKTKLNAKTFRDITRYQGPTNEHGRDAAMLIFGK